MQGNDLSNGSPPRILVHYDVIFFTVEETKKRLFLPSKIVIERVFDDVVLNKLWLLRDRISCTLELLCFDSFSKELEEMLENKAVVNPFNNVRCYKSISDVVKELPYRPEVVGVIDIPSRSLMYGSKYFDTARVGL